jgi:hypothetical protein
MTKSTRVTTSALTQPCLPGFEPENIPSDSLTTEQKVIRVLIASARAKIRAAQQEEPEC